MNVSATAQYLRAVKMCLPSDRCHFPSSSKCGQRASLLRVRAKLILRHRVLNVWPDIPTRRTRWCSWKTKDRHAPLLHLIQNYVSLFLSLKLIHTVSEASLHCEGGKRLKCGWYQWERLICGQGLFKSPLKRHCPKLYFSRRGEKGGCKELISLRECVCFGEGRDYRLPSLTAATIFVGWLLRLYFLLAE